MMSAKDNIAKKLGGQGVLAEICDVTQAAVSQWELIPAHYQQTIIDNAPNYGVIILPDDFFVSVPKKIKQIRRPNRGMRRTSQ